MQRYWNGAAWTRGVSDGQLVLADKYEATHAAAPSPPDAPAPGPSGQPAGWSPSTRSWYRVLWLVVGGVLAVALGVILVLTSPPAPISDIPAQAGLGALSVLIGGAPLTSALIDGLVQVARRVRGRPRLEEKPAGG